ncbi:50S ribosomal protein L10 [Candidatus Aerophobetes bacterium]|uniref:Large ribosomal subunit protein uL10 n=1 Tax=Aerophobetes bacterium TaxID=2030807 RepID=A0A2A4X6Z5_UNCAE|nr:MAG: 50S ribosomal protein L10 [Candidatus Aerophobetes bacterium]
MRDEKQLLLDEVVNTIEQSDTFVITSYNKINPNLDHELRSAIRKAGGSYTVVKKRILAKAASDLGLSIDEGILEGHVALATATDDGVATTKVLFDFSKEHKDTLKVLGGRFEGQIYDGAYFKQISDLPSKQELRSQIVGLLEAPMSQTVRVIDSMLSCLLHCIENKIQKEE